MSQTPSQPLPTAALDERVAQLEARLGRIEAQLGVPPATAPVAMTMAPVEPAPPTVETSVGARPVEDELERQIGQNGFAIAGIFALTAGVGFMLSLPYPGWPAAAPAASGVMLAGVLLMAAQRGRRALGNLAEYIRGAAMALLFLATLRLFYFGLQPALELNSWAGLALVTLMVAANAAVAWQGRSVWLTLLALVMGCVAGLAVGSGAFLIALLPLLATATVLAAKRRQWPVILLAGIPLIYATYFAWAIGTPFHGGHFHYVREPGAAPWILLLTTAIIATGHLFRTDREQETGVVNAGALLNCVLGYACFLLHTAAAFPGMFVALHLAAFLLFLGGAVLFWMRERSRVSTFFYALTGYGALSMAILKAAPAPEVFVWLSGQSLVVVTTAIWFRSRLIVVANFLIYAAIVLGYMVVASQETGISLGFGLVALVSARILRWQKARLELKTELMRNAYLVSAFIVFPYALYHLAPARFVALSWVGLAVGYYALNLIVRNQKYRWMGHATLGLAALLLLLAVPGGVQPIYRIVSFLALGTVLLVVSMAFARAPPLS
ncbi:MAG: hypothetical protein RIQ93_542 [Verrucomicrobiota bacterium]